MQFTSTLVTFAIIFSGISSAATVNNTTNGTSFIEYPGSNISVSNISNITTYDGAAASNFKVGGTSALVVMVAVAAVLV
ncbi:hypothetical protein DASC09_051700 [Saccharomycopsis crataegensis]|uniref:Uncharacterized protein n=1 Tax=Saccharomycopsis crataegensis TaxID=43959 RepID=A0AAV5QTB6_9ASCO|nr:hypothetical protein DASC09_051700 [Saccharomycopsis crataegensis]